MASNETDKDLEEVIVERPNYFAGQYLLEDDFQLEQKYHIDRQRRHNRLLHVSGIAKGLEVSKFQELTVKVSAGIAIDSQGRQIILLKEQNVDLVGDANNNKSIDNRAYTLSIKYNEEKVDKQGQEDMTKRRVQEKPVFELSLSLTSDVIQLAKLTINGNNVEKIDLTVREYSGICLPTQDGKGVTLRSHGGQNPNLAILDGGLSISKTLAVTGQSILTGNVNAQGSLTVTGTTQLTNTLTVKENTTLQKDLNVIKNFTVIGTSMLTGNVSVTHNLISSGIIYSGISEEINSIPLTTEDYEIKIIAVARLNDSQDGGESNLYIRKQGEALFPNGLGMGKNKGLNTIILNPDGTVKRKSIQDEIEDSLDWNNWAEWVNQYASNGDVVAVGSHDEMRDASKGKGSSAEKLLESIGAVKAFTAGQGLNHARNPYALLFIKGGMKAIEVSKSPQ